MAAEGGRARAQKFSMARAHHLCGAKWPGSAASAASAWRRPSCFISFAASFEPAAVATSARSLHSRASRHSGCAPARPDRRSYASSYWCALYSSSARSRTSSRPSPAAAAPVACGSGDGDDAPSRPIDDASAIRPSDWSDASAHAASAVVCRCGVRRDGGSPSSSSSSAAVSSSAVLYPAVASESRDDIEPSYDGSRASAIGRATRAGSGAVAGSHCASAAAAREAAAATCCASWASAAAFATFVESSPSEASRLRTRRSK